MKKCSDSSKLLTRDRCSNKCSSKRRKTRIPEDFKMTILHSKMDTEVVL